MAAPRSHSEEEAKPGFSLRSDLGLVLVLPAHPTRPRAPQVRSSLLVPSQPPPSAWRRGSVYPLEEVGAPTVHAPSDCAPASPAPLPTPCTLRSQTLLHVFKPFHVASLRPVRYPRFPRSPRPHRRRRRRRRPNAGCQPLPGPEGPVRRTAKPSWTSSAGRIQPWLGWAFSGNHGGSGGGLRGSGNSPGQGGRADPGAGAPPRGGLPTASHLSGLGFSVPPLTGRPRAPRPCSGTLRQPARPSVASRTCS